MKRESSKVTGNTFFVKKNDSEDIKPKALKKNAKKRRTKTSLTAKTFFKESTKNNDRGIKSKLKKTFSSRKILITLITFLLSFAGVIIYKTLSSKSIRKLSQNCTKQSKHNISIENPKLVKSERTGSGKKVESMIVKRDFELDNESDEEFDSQRSSLLSAGEIEKKAFMASLEYPHPSEDKPTPVSREEINEKMTSDLKDLLSPFEGLPFVKVLLTEMYIKSFNEDFCKNEESNLIAKFIIFIAMVSERGVSDNHNYLSEVDSIPKHQDTYRKGLCLEMIEQYSKSDFKSNFVDKFLPCFTGIIRFIVNTEGDFFTEKKLPSYLFFDYANEVYFEGINRLKLCLTRDESWCQKTIDDGKIDVIEELKYNNNNKSSKNLIEDSHDSYWYEGQNLDHWGGIASDESINGSENNQEIESNEIL